MAANPWAPPTSLIGPFQSDLVNSAISSGKGVSHLGTPLLKQQTADLSSLQPLLAAGNFDAAFKLASSSAGGKGTSQLLWNALTNPEVLSQMVPNWTPDMTKAYYQTAQKYQGAFTSSGESGYLGAGNNIANITGGTFGTDWTKGLQQQLKAGGAPNPYKYMYSPTLDKSGSFAENLIGDITNTLPVVVPAAIGAGLTMGVGSALGAFGGTAGAAGAADVAPVTASSLGYDVGGLTASNAAVGGVSDVGAVLSAAAPSASVLPTAADLAAAGGSIGALPAAIPEIPSALSSLGTAALSGAERGAATGAITSTIRGGNPLTGAALGAVTGGVGAGVGDVASSELGSVGGKIAGGAAGGATGSALTGGNVPISALTGGVSSGVGAETTSLTGSTPLGTAAGAAAGSYVGSALGPGQSYTGGTVASPTTPGGAPATNWLTQMNPANQTPANPLLPVGMATATQGMMPTTPVSSPATPPQTSVGQDALSWLGNNAGTIAEVGLGLYESNQAKNLNQNLANELKSVGQPLITAGQTALDQASKGTLNAQQAGSQAASFATGTQLQGEATPLLNIANAAFQNYVNGSIPPWQQQQLDQQQAAEIAQARQSLGPQVDSSSMSAVTAQINQKFDITKGQLVLAQYGIGKDALSAGTSIEQLGYTDIQQGWQTGIDAIQQNINNAISLSTAGFGPLADAIALQIQGDTQVSSALMDMMGAIGMGYAIQNASGKSTGPTLGGILGKAAGSLGIPGFGGGSSNVPGATTPTDYTNASTSGIDTLPGYTPPDLSSVIQGTTSTDTTPLPSATGYY